MIFQTQNQNAINHGCTPANLVTSTIISIPKGRSVNITDSVNYRGIALSSIYGKILDLCFLLCKFTDRLVTCLLYTSDAADE